MMATVIDKKYTAKDSLPEILKAIKTLAGDDNHRVLLTDEVKWLETKLREIGRLAAIAQKKAKP